MKAIQYLAAQQVACTDIALPSVPEGFAKIKVAYAGICGGDLNVLGGTHPRAKAPLIMGHEFSGVLAEDSANFKAGTPVCVFPLISCGTCTPCTTGDAHVCNTLRLYGIDKDGGMAEYAIVPEDTLVALDPDMDLKLGALIEPIAVAVHNIRDTGFRPGDNALVIGSGPIGLCIALCLRHFGAQDIVVAETDEKRRALASDMGFTTVNPIETDLVAFALKHTGGDGYDRVYDVAGVPAVADILFDLVKVRGEIIIAACYKKPTAFNFFKGHVKECSISFTRVYRRADYQTAANLAATDPNFAKMITHTFTPEEAAEGFALAQTPGSGACKVMFAF